MKYKDPIIYPWEPYFAVLGVFIKCWFPRLLPWSRMSTQVFFFTLGVPQHGTDEKLTWPWSTYRTPPRHFKCVGYLFKVFFIKYKQKWKWQSCAVFSELMDQCIYRASDKSHEGLIWEHIVHASSLSITSPINPDEWQVLPLLSLHTI